MLTIDSTYLSQLQKSLDGLMAKTSWPLIELKNGARLYSAHSHQGVYLISNEDDSVAIYVGKTNDGTIEKGLADRLWGHLEKRSALRSGYPDLNACQVRSLEIADAQFRGRLELYAISVLCPTMNRIFKRAHS